MTGALFTCLRIAVVALVAQHALTDDQKCYYPNGKEAPEKPCSSAEGSACCPDKWECLDNGLCHYAADNIFGRYSCTDQSWKAEGCPSNLCTDVSKVGGESITQCSDHGDQWCCNADNVHVKCCAESPAPRPFFNLQDGKAYATVGASTPNSVPNLATITGQASGSGNDNSPSATQDSQPSSDSPSHGSSNSPTPTGPTTPVTAVQTSVSSGSAGVSTMIITVVSQPSAQPSATTTDSSATNTTNSNSDSKSKLPVIVGCAVGVPLGLALLGILFWLLRKRHNQKKSPPYSETPDPYANGTASPDFAGGAKLSKANKNSMYKSEKGPDVPELSGQSVGPGRPISTIQGRAELPSGTGFVPGAAPAHAPHLVGVGGGNGNGMTHTPQSSWGSAPPGYSPGMNQNAWTPVAPNRESAELDATPIVPAAAAPGSTTGGGRYIPYRPPQGHAAYGHGQSGLQNVPEVPELSAVRTPPA